MTRSTVLGKRKANDLPPSSIETRKRRALRSTAAAEPENDENAPPREILVSDIDTSAVLQEDSVVRITDFGDDDTPCRRREKRGKKVLFAGAHLRKPVRSSVTHSHQDLDSSKTSTPTQLATPKTPRHRDALSEVPTPRHQVRVAGRVPLTPKTPRTPRTPNGSAITIYNTARQLFARGGDSDGLIGRVSERNAIKAFIEGGIADRTGRAMYISGPPGTGKSAFTNRITEDFRGVEGVRHVYVNCMSVRNSQDLFARLLEELAADGSQTEEDMQQTLKAMFVPKQKSQQPMYLITLDEVDNLLNLNVETLYTLFEWALDKASNMALIGIANALDLTDRFLPRLKAKNLRPQLLPFIPYTAPQIVSVITSRLRSALPAGSPDGFVPFVQAPAIQLCAKKVASQTGDLRKAFDIVRRAIDLVEADVRTKHAAVQSQQQATSPSAPRILGENTNLASSSKRPTQMSPPATARSTATALANLTALTAPRASLVHVSKVTSSAFGNGTANRLKTLNLQQKAALCAVVAHTNRVLASAQAASPSFTSLAASSTSAPSTPHRNKLGLFASPNSNAVFGQPAPMSAAAIRAAQAPTVRQLYAVYVSLCRRDGALAVLTSTEFADVVASLEALGLVVEERDPFASPRKSKGLGVAREEKRVRGCVAEKEVEASLDGAAGELLRSLLKGQDA